jgi:hypothetical protein
MDLVLQSSAVINDQQTPTMVVLGVISSLCVTWWRAKWTFTSLSFSYVGSIILLHIASMITHSGNPFAIYQHILGGIMCSLNGVVIFVNITSNIINFLAQQQVETAITKTFVVVIITSIARLIIGTGILWCRVISLLMLIGCIVNTLFIINY